MWLCMSVFLPTHINDVHVSLNMNNYTITHRWVSLLPFSCSNTVGTCRRRRFRISFERTIKRPKCHQRR